jgi:hypothetical protein
VLADVSDNRADGDIDAALDVHGVHGGGDRLGALFDDGLRKKGRGGGARPPASPPVFSFGLLQQICSDVLKAVGEFDLFGDRDAILADAGWTKRLVEHDIAIFRTRRDLYGISQKCPRRGASSRVLRC